MIRALICDDELDMYTVIEYFIKAEGLPVALLGHAANGLEAQDMIKKLKPDLVFMDIHMPFMNGLEVIQKYPDVKYIIITAYGSFEYAQRALRLGACDIIAKPIDFEQLKQAIFKAFDLNLTGNSMVDQVMEYIHQHYTEGISMENLAQMSFCSETHLSRVFKKTTGMTVKNYIHKLRIDRAEYLIRKEYMSLESASFEVGYHSLNNFYKYFKQFRGETPAAYFKNK